MRMNKIKINNDILYIIVIIKTDRLSDLVADC